MLHTSFEAELNTDTHLHTTIIAIYGEIYNLNLVQKFEVKNFFIRCESFLSFPIHLLPIFVILQ